MANVRSLPSFDNEIEKEWRAFFNGKGRYCPPPVNFEVRERDLMHAEIRAVQEAGTQSLSWTAGNAGGFFVPMEWHNRLLAAMRSYDEIFDDEFSNVIESATGNPIPVPQLDDVGAASVLVGENSNAQSPGTTFKTKSTLLNAYSFRSGLIFVTLELLQDSGIPLGALLEKAFAIRHARGVGQAMISGTGSSQPTGLVVAAVAANNIVVAAGSAPNDGSSATGANSIGSQDLADVYGALNRAYRRNAVWYMSDDTLVNHILPLLDKNGRPLVQIQHDPYLLYNRPIAICPSMDDVAPTANTIVFADPNYILQRRIMAGSYVRMSFQTPGAIESGNATFQSWYRTDANLAVPNPTYPPCAVLRQAS